MWVSFLFDQLIFRFLLFFFRFVFRQFQFSGSASKWQFFKWKYWWCKCLSEHIWAVGWQKAYRTQGNASILRLVKSSLLIYALQIVVQCKRVHYAHTHKFVGFAGRLVKISFDCALDPDGIAKDIFDLILWISDFDLCYCKLPYVSACVWAQKTRFMVIAKVLRIFMCVCMCMCKCKCNRSSCRWGGPLLAARHRLWI